MIIPAYKLTGKTPLETINDLRTKGDIPKDERASYAGRLDPMAEGLLLVLTGDDVEKQKEFENLDKTYMAEIVFGIGTDSHDLLGIPTLTESVTITESAFEAAISARAGSYTTEVPLYSSVKVEGNSLYWHARNNSHVVLPERTTTIFAITDILYGECRGEILQLEAIEKIKSVIGDFRQQEIIHAWEALPMQNETFPTVQCTISCSSGTYIRSLARDLGEIFGTQALVRSLIRTSAGEYRIPGV